jgi:hypothetical protein
MSSNKPMDSNSTTSSAVTSTPTPSSITTSIGSNFIEKESDRIWFYMDKLNLQQGPISSANVAELVMDGIIDGTTYG